MNDFSSRELTFAAGRRRWSGARNAAATLTVLWALCSSLLGLGQTRYIETQGGQGNFVIADHGQAAPLYVDGGDYAGVVRAVSDLQTDI